MYQKYGEKEWAQAKYLVHGYDDVLWTNNVNEAVLFLRESMKKLDEEYFTEKKNQ
ncbi:MAG: hypothetical protein ACW980_24580 [Promethearchaeota archaeon]